MWDQVNWASSAGGDGCAGRGEPPAGLVLGNNLVIAPTAPRVTDAQHSENNPLKHIISL